MYRNISISSVEEVKNIEILFKHFLNKLEFNIYTGEGLSINNTNVYLFERFEVNKIFFIEILENLNIMNSRDFLNYFVKLIITQNIYNSKHYSFIKKLLKDNKIIYNIIIYNDDCQDFLWIKFSLYLEFNIDIELFHSCSSLSKKIFLITNKEKNKTFNAVNHLKCIDKCLRNENTPYPGNFDGLIYEKNSLIPKFIIEYSKVDWVYKPNFNKDIKFHLKWYCEDKNRKGWRRDINRWKSLKDLSEFLNIPVYIIWWGTVKEEFSIGELKKIDQDNCYLSISILKEQISEQKLFDFFKTLLKEKK